MIFHRLEIPGAYLLEPESQRDRTGFFTRGYCRQLLEERGLDPALARCDVWVEQARGDVLTPHLQETPEPEVRLVRTVRGHCHHLLIDCREGREGRRGKTLGIELSADSRQALYVPSGVAYGFQSLEDASEVLCQSSELANPDGVRQVPSDAPELAGAWPLPHHTPRAGET